MKTTITSKSKAEVIFQSVGDSLFQVLQYNNIADIQVIKGLSK